MTRCLLTIPDHRGKDPFSQLIRLETLKDALSIYRTEEAANPEGGMLQRGD